jgi:hypothetical protein
MSDISSQYIKIMEENIKKNKSVLLSQFPDKMSLLTHWDKIDGWAQCLDAYKAICAPHDADSANNPSSPPVMEGEVIQ